MLGCIVFRRNIVKVRFVYKSARWRWATRCLRRGAIATSRVGSSSGGASPARNLRLSRLRRNHSSVEVLSFLAGPTSDFLPAAGCFALHILSLVFILQAFTKSPFQTTLYPESWDAANACAANLALCSLAAALRFNSEDRREQFIWRLATPLGLHLGYGIARAHPSILGPRAPTGAQLKLLLRCFIDCTIHACGVAAMLLVVGAAEVASDWTYVARPTLLSVTTSSVFLAYAITAVRRGKRPPTSPAPRPRRSARRHRGPNVAAAPPASAGGPRDRRGLAAPSAVTTAAAATPAPTPTSPANPGAAHPTSPVSPLLATPGGAFAGALLQISFASITIGATMGGLSRGVFRWHLPQRSSRSQSLS